MKKQFLHILVFLSLVAAGWAQATYTVTANPTTYSASGGQITFNVALSYPADAVPSIAAKPPGLTWAFVSAGGTNTPNGPNAGETTDPTDPSSVLGFYYITAPANSASFAFVVSYPAGLTGNQVFTFTADYRVGGVRTPVTVPSITLTPPPSGPPAINSPASASGSVGTVFNYAITATNSPTSFAATNLPAGLTLNTTTGVITGTPTTAGTYSTVSLTATNGSGVSAAFALTITINPSGAPVITSGAAAAGIVGAAFTYTIIATNSPTSFAAANLPAGLTLNATTGVIGGTPTTAGTYNNVSLTATNGVGTSAPVTLTITVTSTGGVNYTVTANPATYSASGGQITFNVALSYPPDAVPSIAAKPPGNTWAFVSTGGTNPPNGPNAGETTDPTDPSSVLGFYYITAPANSASFAFVVSYPAGLTGNQVVTFTADYRVGGVRTPVTVPPITLTPPPPGPPTINSPASASGTVGTAFNYAITATNSPTSFAAVNLPAGLTVNTTTGVISGTPTTAGTYSTVSLTATNGAGTSAAFPLTITVAPSGGGLTPPVITTQPASLTRNQSQTATFTVVATGNPAPTYLWRKDANNLADGGNVSGATTATLTLTNLQASDGADYSVFVSNTQGNITSQPANLTVIVPPIITTQPQSRTVAAGGSVTFLAVVSSQGLPTYQWRKGGSIISGATLGAYSINPVQVSDAGDYAVDITNAAGTTTSATATLTVSSVLSSTLAVATKAVTSGAAVVAFTPVTAAGGAVPYTFSIAPALPAGLSLNATTGAITGTPSAASTATNYTVTITDNASATTSKAFSLTVNAPLTTTLAIASNTLTVGTAATPFTPVTATGGTAPFAVAIVPALPTGLTISSTTGEITGTPTAVAAAANYTVSFTDSAGAVSSKIFNLTVNAAPVVPVISSPTTASGVTGVSFSYTITASNSPTSFAATGLPAGLALNTSTGVISGTPTAAGTSPVSMTATNASGASAVVTLTITVIDPVAAAITTQPANQYVDAGQTATFTVVATGVPSPTFQWKKNGSDVSGATNATLAITNVQATNEGSYTVVVSNGVGSPVTSSAATLGIKAAPVITTQPVSQAVVEGGSVTFNVVATGKPPTFTYQWKKGGNNISGATAASYTIAAVATTDAAAYTVVVSNGVGTPATSSAANLTVAPAGFAATHSVVGGGYVAGGTLSVTSTFNYTSELASLTWSVLLPTGFKFVSCTYTAGTPSVEPAANDLGYVSWVWSSIPATGTSFTYVISVPADATGEKSLAALVEFTLASNSQVIPMVAKPDPLVATQLLYHTADTNGNWKIDVSELSRVITLYNARYTYPDGSGKVRTGYYKEAPAGTVTADGFVPDTTNDGTAPITLTRFHNADYNKNGKIDVAELSRVITLYNARYTYPDGSGKIRTGYYKQAPGTVPDGFAPDPTRVP